MTYSLHYISTDTGLNELLTITHMMTNMTPEQALEVSHLQENEMRKHEVRTPEQAIAYLTDCTLATVVSLAMKKRRTKYEYCRQKAIAQQAIFWMDAMKIDYSGTRAEDVKSSGSIEQWVLKYEV